MPGVRAAQTGKEVSREINTASPVGQKTRHGDCGEVYPLLSLFLKADMTKTHFAIAKAGADHRALSRFRKMRGGDCRLPAAVPRKNDM